MKSRRKIDRRNLGPINYRELKCSAQKTSAIYYCTFCSGYLLFVYSQLSQGRKYKLKVSPLLLVVSALELRKFISDVSQKGPLFNQILESSASNLHRCTEAEKILT